MFLLENEKLRPILNFLRLRFGTISKPDCEEVSIVEPLVNKGRSPFGTLRTRGKDGRTLSTKVIDLSITHEGPPEQEGSIDPDKLLEDIKQIIENSKRNPAQDRYTGRRRR